MNNCHLARFAYMRVSLCFLLNSSYAPPFNECLALCPRSLTSWIPSLLSSDWVSPMGSAKKRWERRTRGQGISSTLPLLRSECWHSSKFTFEILMSNAMVLGGGASAYYSGTLMNGTTAPLKETPSELPSPSTLWGHTQEEVCNPEEGPQLPSWHPDLRLPKLKNIFLLLISH